MEAHEEVNNIPDAPPPVENSGRLGQLQAECAHLRQRVLELESERERDRRQLVDLESERDHYRAEAYAWARQAFERKGLPSEEELKRLAKHEDGVPLEAFLADLKRIAEGS